MTYGDLFNIIRNRFYMILKKRRTIGIFVLFGVSILLSLISFQISNGSILNFEDDPNNLLSSPTIITYEIENFSILIDNTNPNTKAGYNTWESWEKNYSWCYKSCDGTYHIKNVEVSNGHNIIIMDSNVDFVIENSNVYMSDSHGIELTNVENGKLLNNNFSYNAKSGIFLKKDSNNNEILNNTITLNSQNGIHIEGIYEVKDYWVSFHPFHIVEETYYSCNYNIIRGNIINFNTDNGVRIKGYDSLNTCKANTIDKNTVTYNRNNGIYTSHCKLHNINANTLENNGYNGIYLLYSNQHSIDDNTIGNNRNNGIYISSSNEHAIEDNMCNDNGNHGLFLSISDNNDILRNTVNNNNESGIYLKKCITSYNWNNKISLNTFSNNKFGIYLSSSEHNYIGTGNIVNKNTQYGIYLSDESKNNKVTGNSVNKNTLYDICYENDDCVDNIFENNGVETVNLGNINSGAGNGGFNIEVLLPIVFIGVFAGILVSIGHVSRTTRKKSREEKMVEKNIYNRPRSKNQEGITGNVHQVAPYEFYCSKCDNKSIGYQVFCPTCGERMKQPDLVSSSETLKKNSCVICHSSICTTCNHDMTGEDECYEECPYCGRSYHKHCWDKAIQIFGKCGFCLETPPPELIPKSTEINIKSDSNKI